MPWILLLLAALFTARFPPPPSPACRRLTLIKTAPANPMWNRKERLMPHWPMCWPTTPPVRSSLTSCVKQPPPPPDSTPTLTPPAVKEDHGTGERHPDKPGIWRTAHHAFPSCGAISPAHRISPLIRKPLPARHGIFTAGRAGVLVAGTPRGAAAVSQMGEWGRHKPRSR